MNAFVTFMRAPFILTFYLWLFVYCLFIHIFSFPSAPIASVKILVFLKYKKELSLQSSAV